MNEIFGVSPELAVNADQFATVLSRFGFHNGRFVGEFPSTWRRRVHERIDGLLPVEQMRFRTILERQRHLFVKVGATYDASLSWDDNCVELLGARKVDGAISANVRASRGWYSVANVVDGELPDASGARVLATGENLLRALEVVIRTSQEVYIVDPYLAVWNRDYWPFLRLVVSSAWSRDTTFWLFSKRERFDARELFSTACRRCFERSTVAPGCRLLFVPLGGDDADEMHGRYAFNIYGGVTYDKGFRENREMLVDISTMSPGLHQRHFAQYNQRAKDAKRRHIYPAIDAVAATDMCSAAQQSV